MSIETLMEGDPDSVTAAADWLNDLAGALDEGRANTRRGRERSRQIWGGIASNGYRDFASDLLDACRETETRAEKATDRFRSYSQQLRWRQEDMEGHRTDAANGGLTVVGTVIHQPPTAVRPTMPSGDVTEQQVNDYNAKVERYNAALAKIDVYSRTQEKVQKTFERLDDWVVEHLVPQEASVQEPSAAGVMAAGLKQLPPVARDLVVSTAEETFKQRSDDILAAARAKATADAAARSGNPAVRSGRKPPREEAVQKRLDRRTGYKNKMAKAAKWSKGLGIVGLAITVATGGAEIAAGASPSSVGIETIAGIGGGILGGAAVVAGAAALGVAAPAFAVAAGAAVVGGLVAWGAGAAYEHLVPQHVREKIDEGIRDTASAVWDGAKSAGRWVKGLFT